MFFRCVFVDFNWLYPQQARFFGPWFVPQKPTPFDASSRFSVTASPGGGRQRGGRHRGKIQELVLRELGLPGATSVVAVLVAQTRCICWVQIEEVKICHFCWGSTCLLSKYDMSKTKYRKKKKKNDEKGC